VIIFKLSKFVAYFQCCQIRGVSVACMRKAVTSFYLGTLQLYLDNI